MAVHFVEASGGLSNGLNMENFERKQNEKTMGSNPGTFCSDTWISGSHAGEIPNAQSGQ
jgi:hypothetical protein